jgi:hypothetical protein
VLVLDSCGILIHLFYLCIS